MRSLFRLAVFAVMLVLPFSLKAAEPVYVGLDAEFTLRNSTSAQAIEQGIRTAIDEINRTGGVLGGRPLALVTRDNRSVPARALVNLQELSKMKDLVAVFEGRFSPTILQSLEAIHKLGLIVLDPWGSANGITDHDFRPSYIYRLSLKDNYAMPTMLGHATDRGFTKVGLLVPNTGWGRSNAAAAELFVRETGKLRLTDVLWYNWGDRTLLEKYMQMVAGGSEAVVMVANDLEGGALVKDVSVLPDGQRIPIISHWGITGGYFVEVVGDALDKVDLTVVQTFSFMKANKAKVSRFMETYTRLFGEVETATIKSPVGVGHGYDLTHILARAIDLAGSTDRVAVRDALEKVRNYSGLIRDYGQVFTPERHDALALEDVFMARYRKDGAIIPLD